ncbi:MAG: MmgE/PrpD family protein [Rhodospirillaceae bacterium]
MSTLLNRLVAHLDSIRCESLTPSAVAAAKRALLDALGCAIAAIGCEPAAIAARALARGAPAATVIGEAQPASLEHAILLNGILVRYLDMMDVYSARDVCHPAENVPIALASVEQAQQSGKRLIEAIVAGYEAQMRLAHALSLQQMGMHHVTAGGMVAPLIIAKAWGLSRHVMEQAAALGGCRQFTVHALSKGGLSMAKAIGYPWAGMDAVLAVRLAEQGYTGPTAFIDWLANEGPLKGSVDADALDRADATMMIVRVSYKQFPIQFELQTPVELAIGLHQQIGGAARIQAVEVSVRPITIKRTADPAKFAPKNRETADHSLPVCVAMALIDGKITAAQFESGRWRDEDVSQLVARIRVDASEEYDTGYPNGRPAALRVTLSDGNVLQAFQAVPLGDVTRPMDDATITRKFLANASDALGSTRAQDIVACVHRLDELPRIDELTGLLRTP